MPTPFKTITTLPHQSFTKKLFVMETIAFKMQLLPGFEEEYKKRHEKIWPELTSLLKAAGIRDYYIFLDSSTNALFAFLKTDNTAALDELPQHSIMQKWWKYMADIMETNADASPVVQPLDKMFFMA
jgi:L-rhamnose mutarotase